MTGCPDNCGLCSVCTLSEMERRCDALAAERDALRARVAELEGELEAVRSCWSAHEDCDQDEGCCLFSDLCALLTPKPSPSPT